MQYTSRRRTGVTLPELMVAAAMSMVIMLIIAFAFREGVKSFRTLRAVGQMQDRMRSAQNVLKRDLAAEHFGGLFQQGLSGPYVRDQRLDLVGWKPPEEGYFEVKQGSPSQVEAFDSDGIPSYVATNHSLRFTVKLTGKRQQDWFYAAGATGGDLDFSISSAAATRWAEIAYFLVDSGETTADGATKLYSLRRQEKALNVSGSQTSATVAQVVNRHGGANFVYASNTTGDDILLTDVLSFEVKVAWTPSIVSAMGNVSPTLPLPPGNLDWPVSNLPPDLLLPQTLGNRFDTGSLLDVQTANPNYDWNNPASFNATVTGAPRFRVRMSTVQIRLRVWDKSTQTTRQMTIVQDV